MFKLIKKMLGIKTKRAYKPRVQKEKVETIERDIHRCHCGRKTVIKNHTKTVDKNGKVEYSFHIICPNCGNDICGKASKLDEAKNIAISRWNRSNHMSSYWVNKGIKQVVRVSTVGRPHKA